MFSPDSESLLPTIAAATLACCILVMISFGIVERIKEANPPTTFVPWEVK